MLQNVQNKQKEGRKWGKKRVRLPGIKQISHEDAVSSRGNIVNNLVITCTVTDGCWDLS